VIISKKDARPQYAGLWIALTVGVLKGYLKATNKPGRVRLDSAENGKGRK
jgi:hypothetical protein